MTPQEDKFHEIASTIEGATKGQMFGCPCYKLNKKVYSFFYKTDIVCKLPEEPHREAMALEGAQLFDPMKGRPMKQWVQIPFDYVDQWNKYVLAAAEYIGS